MKDMRYSMELTEIPDHFSIKITDGDEFSEWAKMYVWNKAEHCHSENILLTIIDSDVECLLETTDYNLNADVAKSTLIELLKNRYDQVVSEDTLTADDISLFTKYQIEITVYDHEGIKNYSIMLWHESRLGFLKNLFAYLHFTDQAKNILDTHINSRTR